MVEMCLYEIHNKSKSIIICNELDSHIKSYNLEITRGGPKILSSKRIKMKKMENFLRPQINMVALGDVARYYFNS
jgi:hypothetical protein